jgi:hypothetical protein
MSQAWIKIETVTADKIEIARVATALGMDRYAVLGRLIRLWGYFDQHSLDGHIDGVNASFIDGLVGHPGFCAQLVAVGWMEIDEAGVTLPNFDRHNGATAKSRALAARRLEKHRGRTVAKETPHRCKRNAAPLQPALPEERREEEKREDENSPTGGQPFLPFTSPGDIDPATALAQKFAFLGGEATSMGSISRARAMIVDLLAAKIPAGDIETELDRPDRPKSEHPGEMRRRLMKETDHANGTRTDAGHYDPTKPHPSAKSG